jgi:cytochrome c peroxidase
LGWCDNRTFSFGHDRQLGVRNAMSIINTAYAKNLFWDGRLLLVLQRHDGLETVFGWLSG